MSLAANLMRKIWAKNDRKRDKDNTEPDNLTIYRDISYTASESDRDRIFHLTDIYRPIVSDETLPVIVSIHGGGWFYGDKELYRFYCMHLASKGFVVVNPNYRLAPESKYPAAIADVCLLMDFIRQNAAEYGMDTEHLFMVGDSAGAQLVSQYCILSTNKDYGSLLSQSANDIRSLMPTLPIPAAVGLNCGIYDMNEIKGQKISQWYLPKQVDSPLADSFWNVLSYMTSEFPPAYLMLSVNDDLKVHTAAMKTKLEDLGISFRYKEFGEGCPEDGHVFHINLKSQNGLLCNAEECDYFRSFCD
ncbi:MAG: alpha/beta hydrolase [Lachnospiraceae bacterium]